MWCTAEKSDQYHNRLADSKNRSAEAQRKEKVCKLRQTLCANTLLDGFAGFLERQRGDESSLKRLGPPLKRVEIILKHSQVFEGHFDCWCARLRVQREIGVEV